MSKKRDLLTEDDINKLVDAQESDEAKEVAAGLGMGMLLTQRLMNSSFDFSDKLLESNAKALEHALDKLSAISKMLYAAQDAIGQYDPAMIFVQAAIRMNSADSKEHLSKIAARANAELDRRLGYERYE